MSVFGNYARYYDLLYKDKDYTGEADYVHTLLQKYGKSPKSILELGCGTGIHASLLAKKGYTVTGVDTSKQMLDSANARVAKLKLKHVFFKQGDIRNVRLHQEFDAVISLFHVFSYQTTNEDLIATIRTAKQHLKRGGLLIFDCWYGPGVLTDPPAVRVKRLQDRNIKVVRIAEPVVFPNINVVNVNYTILIKDKTTGKAEEIRETHKMRYLFKPEIEVLLESSTLKLVFSKEWLKDKAPGFHSWAAVFGGKKCL